MNARINLHPAFILHMRAFRDTSSLIELFTLEYGKVHVLARSARGLRSRFKGLLQPFSPFLTSWSGATDLMYLNRAESNGLPYYLTGNALISGFYLNELLLRLLHRDDPHPQLYLNYQQTLTQLQQGKQLSQTLRCFEWQLLVELGYGCHLNKEALSGREIVAENWYRYDTGQGFFLCEPQTQHPAIFRGKSLLALQHNQFSDVEDLQQTKRLLRLMLSPLLGNRPIKSRELFF